ncbi:MAG: protein-glutamate O-methyltransferase CheR [Phycisphaerae bacterium]|jgi:chemotaxis methyl-accepting protein methylase|nr:protein-glutamate O-methyltransferase CheR [Phycisphaerae bacterium]
MAADLVNVLAALKALRGVDLSGYRHDTLQRRVAARMATAQAADVDEYARQLYTDPDECDRLINTITIKVSSFFRDPIVFELTAQKLLGDIIDRNRRKDAPGGDIRVWSAGCATGEEAWSLAILIHQALKGEGSNWTVQIFATDLDPNALATAETGAYPGDRFKNVKLGVLDQYFDANEDGYRIRPFLRRMVRFSRDDLVSTQRHAPAESVFGTFDLIFCRNVLIYYSRDVQGHIFRRLHRSLGRQGYLVLGNAEGLNTEMESKLQTIDRMNRIYRKPR